MHVDRAKLQQFLLEKFSADELKSLLAQHFAAVYYEMTLGMKKSQQINMLLDYCQKQDQFELLFRELQERRPRNFDPADYSATPETYTASPQKLNANEPKIDISLRNAGGYNYEAIILNISQSELFLHARPTVTSRSNIMVHDERKL